MPGSTVEPSDPWAVVAARLGPVLPLPRPAPPSWRFGHWLCREEPRATICRARPDGARAGALGRALRAEARGAFGRMSVPGGCGAGLPAAWATFALGLRRSRAPGAQGCSRRSRSWSSDSRVSVSSLAAGLPHRGRRALWPSPSLIRWRVHAGRFHVKQGGVRVYGRCPADGDSAATFHVKRHVSRRSPTNGFAGLACAGGGFGVWSPSP